MKRKIGIGILVLTLCISSFSLAFADINYDVWNSPVVYPKDVVNTKYFTSVKALTDKKVITGDTTGLYYLSLIHISEPTRLGMISYAVFCLKKTKTKNNK